MKKRMKKMDRIESVLNGPTLYGPEEADLTLMGWGSTYGAIREAIDRLTKSSIKVNLIHFSDLWPFPVEKTVEALSGEKRLVLFENNYSGQFGRLLRGSTGIVPHKTIVKYDGRPFSADLIIESLVEEEEING
jgi:2-oxoglutarate ferredoxin oxidoreductase subunit alpha